MKIFSNDNKELIINMNRNKHIMNKNDKDNFNLLINILKKYKTTNYSGVIKQKKEFKDLYLWILNKTKFLNNKKNIKLTERIYYIIKGITQPVLCKICKNNFVGLKGIHLNFRKYCSNKCSRKDKEIYEKMKNTCLKKYGKESFLGTKQCLEKTKRTLQSKYGVNNIQQVDFIKKKRKNTILKKYGKIGFQDKNRLNKAQETIKHKYGVNNVMKNEEIKKKIKLIQNKEETKIKRKETVKNKYGVENVSQLEYVRQKAYLTLIEKNEKIKNKDKWFDREFWLKQFSSENGLINIKKASEFFNISIETVRKHLRRIDLYEYRPVVFSKEEMEIEEFILSLNKNIKMIRNDRKIIKPFEIDLFLPEYNLIIEYDGTYWHSVGNDNIEYLNYERYRNFRKINKINEKNLNCFFIRDYEWNDEIKSDICKSIIVNKLKLNKNIIYARECSVKVLNDKKLVDEFLMLNHLQGKTIYYDIAIGLFYKNELVSIMTFGKPRFNSNYDYELLRFCLKKYYTVIGAASKLFKYFCRNYSFKNIISYGNRRFTNGNIYKLLGFTLSHISQPNYYYVKIKHNNLVEIISRHDAQKYKLKNLLDNFDENKTEIENMLNNGYRIMFDGGNFVFTYSLQ